MQKQLTLFLVTVFLCGCGSDPSEEGEITGWNFSANTNLTEGKTIDAAGEIEGPQYQQPTMEVLQGKSQLFPQKYPAKRYPHSKVAMVDVRPNRLPGLKNMVMLTTADAIPQISQYYHKDMIAENWKKTDEYKNKIYESTIWTKGDLECEVRISPDLRMPGKKYVQLLYGKRKTRPLPEADENVP